MKEIKNRKRFVMLLVFLMSMFLIVIVFSNKSIYYYKEAIKLNKNLKADGIEVMMPLDTARNIFGKEEIYN